VSRIISKYVLGISFLFILTVVSCSKNNEENDSVKFYNENNQEIKHLDHIAFVSITKSNLYLENKNIQDLMIDGNNLWIALKPYMLCHFNLITEKINYYKPTNYEKGAITSILKHNDSLLWLGTSKGLLLFNSFTREFTQLPENTFSKPDRLKDIIIQTLYKDSKNRIWIGTYGNGLYKIKTQNNKITYQRYFNTKKIFDIAP